MTKKITKIYDYYNEPGPPNVFDSKWFLTRPADVQAFIRRYPPGVYQVQPGAPYNNLQPGDLVEIVSYGEDGMVGITSERYNDEEIINPVYLTTLPIDYYKRWR